MAQGEGGMSPEDLAERLSRLNAPAESSAPGEGSVTGTGPETTTVGRTTRGCALDVTLVPEQVVAAARVMDQNGFALDAVTGVDWLAESQMEVIYDYFHPANGLRVVVRARVSRETPEIPTISEVFPGANWHERETHDFFGIHFSGHPQLTPLLLPEDAREHPLRKDFQS